jgi:opacity protein-like surface antigen
MLIRTSIASALCLYATTAVSGGLSDPIIPVAPPAPLPVSIPLDWYAGVQLGVASGTIDAGSGLTAFPDTDASGQFYGLHAGVQRNFGAITAGIEVDYNAGELAIDTPPVGAAADSVIEELAHLKLRAGTNVGSALVYGTAGLAYASGHVQPVGPVVDVSDTAAFYGLGAEMMVSDRISVGGEVLVHDFEDMDDSSVDVAFTTAQLRVSYHF